MADNPIQRIKQLDEERASLIDGARKEALAKATEAIAQLASLGFTYHLVEAGRAPRKGAPRQASDAACPICKFKTKPSHDGRRHRAQGERKRPFTPAELKDMGLARI